MFFSRNIQFKFNPASTESTPNIHPALYTNKNNFEI